MHSLKKSIELFTRSSGSLKRSTLIRCLTSKATEAIESNQSTPEKTVLVDRISSIMMIGINRPEKKNCLNVCTAELLVDALDEFDNDDKAVVGILYGVGGNFCSGYDLQEIADYDGKNDEGIPHFSTLSNRKQLTKKPILAAISGYALGVGFELALMCDIRIMEENATFGFLNRRFGIPILSGGTVRLPMMIGYSRAMDVILTGRKISAEEAMNWGLIARKVAYGSVIGQASSIANSLVKFQQDVLLADRASLNYATFSVKELEEALQFEKDNASHLLLEQGVKGARKFCEEGVGRHGKFYNISKQDISFRELDPSLV